MQASEIRQRFIEFFKSKEHAIVPSAPMVVKDDPTLMFTNAGMNQFKDYFLGNKKAETSRVADTQKCLRVSGKHNDLEEVGIDTYHHTMFEMLGNWSFGDYFKREAIQWAWELLVDELKLPVDRIYVTIFEGDQEDGLAIDEEAKSIWKEIVAEDRILPFGKKDNFWEMGDTGPCGPCSEIHIDLRDQLEIDKVSGHELVNADDPQVIEIWNLVFIQFNRMADKSLQELPDKHIDTGMGFERLVRVIQEKKSNYDTDVFSPLLNEISARSGKPYEAGDDQVSVAMRVISDHVRAVTFAIADGQLPSNNGAGYVIRRILRRAVRYAYTFLGIDEPLLTHLVPILAQQFDGVFPEVKGQEGFIQKVVEEEELAFLRTLANGIKRLESIVVSISSEKVIPGTDVFELYDTYGFPVDLTSLMAREQGLSIDEAGFDAAMAEQKNRSRAAAESSAGDWVLVNDVDKVNFLGYDQLSASSRVVKYRLVKEKKGERVQLVLDETPFYPEGGGQVGDSGVLIAGEEKIRVQDTKKENDLIIHYVDKVPSTIEGTFEAHVNQEKRSKSAKNHSATHLLQSALREVLGDHVTQKGSLVTEKLLRFDFSHFSKMNQEEILQVEQIVNEHIRQNIPLDEKRNVPIQEALDSGVTALFGEKYGDFVRVITFDPDYSMELCGGTHVQATGEIGYFKIVSEGSVAAGVRRIEAVTAEAAESYVGNKLELIDQINELLKNPPSVLKALDALLKEKADLAKKLETFQQQAASNLKKDLSEKVQQSGDLSLIIEQIEIDSADSIKQLAFDLRKQVDNLVLILAANVGGKPMIAAMISDNLVEEKSLNAGQIVRELAKEIQGGGGGQPFFATAGGKKLEGLPAVVEKAHALISDN